MHAYKYHNHVYMQVEQLEAKLSAMKADSTTAKQQQLHEQARQSQVICSIIILICNCVLILECTNRKRSNGYSYS